MALELVEVDRQAFLVLSEIQIRCEDRQITTNGNGTDQKVRVGPLYSFGSAGIEELRGQNIVFGHQRQVGEGGKTGFQSRKRLWIPHTGEQFLPDRPNDLNRMGRDQILELFRFRMAGMRFAAQRQGPDTGIHENPHARARCFL